MPGSRITALPHDVDLQSQPNRCNLWFSLKSELELMCDAEMRAHILLAGTAPSKRSVIATPVHLNIPLLDAEGTDIAASIFCLRGISPAMGGGINAAIETPGFIRKTRSELNQAAEVFAEVFKGLQGSCSARIRNEG